MINLVIDGKKTEVEEGVTILNACQKLGVDIPTLCYYKALKPFGGCRMCVVELEKNGKSILNASCTQPAEVGLIVKTNTEKVFRARQMVIRFLLLCAPNADKIKELAKQYKVKEDRFVAEDKNCILCGLCSRMCSDLMKIGAIGFNNRGAKKEILSPFGEQSEICSRCGACNFICPTGKISLNEITDKDVVPNVSKFDMGLGERPNIYIPYPQAIPNVPVIDKENCPQFLKEACGACKEFCDAGAIDYTQKDTEETVDIGAVIVSAGYELYDAGKKGEYGYGRYPNIITNLQLERLLSSSGPTKGEILRPSDGKHPKRIAFIQCVGSRNVNDGNEYCSAVCCMASTKEAVIAREHDPEIKPTIFFIDIRTFGKNFDKYYESAKNEYGVRYVRCMVSKVNEDPETSNLEIKYIDSEGKVKTELFDLVVLAAGLEPSSRIEDLAKKLGVKLNDYKFIASPGYENNISSKEGVYVSATAFEPQDIPESVISGSASASFASSILAPKRGTMVKKKRYPKEKDISKKDLRIGVFICHCGRNISSVVKVKDVADYAKNLPNVFYADDLLYTCSQDGLEEIKKKILENDLNRVVVASCTPRTHEALFRDTVRETGLNPYLFDMASIREQVSWVHRDNPEGATKKAKELVSMMVEKVKLLKPIKRKTVGINNKCLVIGAGISGLTASLSLAKQGFYVFLIEKEKELGGHMREVFFTLSGWNPQEELKKLIQEVEENKLIKIYKDTKLKEMKGFRGNFKSVIVTDSKEQEIEHGSVIVATGAEENKVQEYLYGQDKCVITQTELEKKLAESKDSLKDLKSIVMIQCVGSRDENNPYCSRVCCGHAVKNALKLKELNSDINITIIYRDIMTYGFGEKYYLKAREQGVVFVRYEKEQKPKVIKDKNKIKIVHLDPSIKEDITIEADLLVLSVGMVPPDNKDLSKELKVPLNSEGFFMEAHAKIRPLDFTTEGMYVCGTAHSPRYLEESVVQANGAAVRAVTLLSKKEIETKADIVRVIERKCTGCGMCIHVCPYSAREMDDADSKNVAKVLQAVCQGCGACAIACPSGATEQEGFEKKQIISMIDAA